MRKNVIKTSKTSWNIYFLGKQVKSKDRGEKFTNHCVFLYCDFIVRCLLCGREWPSTLCVDGSAKSGVEARGERYLVVQDPAGPVTGTEP